MLAKFPCLQSPDFRKLFYNYVLTSAAAWASLLGRGWLIFELTGSSSAVGLVTFGGMAPMLFLGPVAGTFADRFDRRKMAMVAALFGALVSFLLGFLTLTGSVVMWHVVVLAILQGTAMAAVTPASEAIIPSLVPPEHLLSAVSFRGIARHGSKVIGPFIGGILMALLDDGTGWVFVLTALFFLMATFQLYRIQWRPSATLLPSTESIFNVISPMAAAAKYAYVDKRLLMVLSLIGVHCGFTMAYDALLPGLSDEIGSGSSTFAAISVGVGFGALITTLAVSTISDESARGRILIVSGLGSGISLLFIGFATNPLVAIFGGFLSGATEAPYMAVSATLIQQVVPDEYRGRMMAVYIMIAAGFMAFMNLGFGLVADFTGERILFIVPSVLWLIIFVFGGLFSPGLRHLLRTGSFRTEPATELREPVSS
ncbi:MAG: MFS transporter [Dehalococcoidia bacterium]|nr:MFS transporter [Dehalococcoidia bacterium]